MVSLVLVLSTCSQALTPVPCFVLLSLFQKQNMCATLFINCCKCYCDALFFARETNEVNEHTIISSNIFEIAETKVVNILRQNRDTRDKTLLANQKQVLDIFLVNRRDLHFSNTT